MGHVQEFKIHGFLSDMEGQRQVFASKGSAALRPCLFCCNVVKHGSGLAELRNELVEISCADRTQLKKTSAREIFACCDHLSTEPWSTRRELERLEQTLGFLYQPAGLMFDRELRGHMSPNDPLHCYFQGGVASWEAALLMNRLQSELGLGLESIARGVAAVRWQTSSFHPQMRSQQWQKNLFHPKRWNEDQFKGEVKELRVLLPLLFYMAKLKAEDKLQAELDCMEVLLSLMYLSCH